MKESRIEQCGSKREQAARSLYELAMLGSASVVISTCRKSAQAPILLHEHQHATIRLLDFSVHNSQFEIAGADRGRS